MSEASYDLVIVGGGVAGLCAALAAPPGARIAVIDKGEAGAGSSPLAQGGLAAAVGSKDSTGLHARDTVAAGAGLCDAGVVQDICEQGPAAIEWLLRLGCDFDRSEDGSLDLAREGGQTVARSVHWRDATGAEIVRALRAAVRGRDVTRIDARARLLLSDPTRCWGVSTTKQRVVSGRAVLLATGGCGGLWASTTNAPRATGDGIALALIAGARVADLEFMQFHPTALATPGAQQVLLTEALRGAGATLVTESGERFVDELAPRHVVAKAILDVHRAFLDCRGVAGLPTRFPTVVAAARARGFDPLTEPLPVRPAAHYFIGGVAADAYGRTSISGLYAAGECASTGMHGANRMAGNSLLEAVVVGRRASSLAAEEPAPPKEFASWVPSTSLDVDPDPALPSIMWEGVGPIRDADRLSAAREAVQGLLPSPHHLLAALIVSAALAREETRGVHIRADHSLEDERFGRRSFTSSPEAVAEYQPTAKTARR
jgi:L-aspartate oxidase